MVVVRFAAACVTDDDWQHFTLDDIYTQEQTITVVRNLSNTVPLALEVGNDEMAITVDRNLSNTVPLVLEVGNDEMAITVDRNLSNTVPLALEVGNDEMAMCDLQSLTSSLSMTSPLFSTSRRQFSVAGSWQ